MKVDIITVFKAENCGSFLQAWALKEQLSLPGNDVYFYDYNSTGTSYAKKISNIIKCCLRLKFKRAGNIWKKTLAFKKCQQGLKTARPEEAADLYFFGSDTLWNFEDAFFAKNASVFTGAGIENPCYAYSISVASTSKESLMKVEGAVENIQKFKRIAVRDKHTEEVLSAFYPSEKIVRTLDPTMLMEKEAYIEHFSSKKKLPQKTLVIYHFGVIPADTWKALQAYAKKKGLTIVNVGMYEKQFDCSVVPTPDNFISAFSSAEYIFTNTFHGCVFSTIFNKSFATDGMHKKKIEGFLEEFSLLDRTVSSAENVERVLETPVDYERVNALVKEKREKSVEYLDRCIREVKGHE